jgi:hypothetical protein
MTKVDEIDRSKSNGGVSRGHITQQERPSTDFPAIFWVSVFPGGSLATLGRRPVGREVPGLSTPPRVFFFPARAIGQDWSLAATTPAGYPRPIWRNHD